MTTSRDTAIDLLAEALVLTAAEVDDATALGVTAQWDSLAHLRLILALEGNLGRRLTPEEIVSIASLSDVVAIIEL